MFSFCFCGHETAPRFVFVWNNFVTKTHEAMTGLALTPRVPTKECALLATTYKIIYPLVGRKEMAGTRKDISHHRQNLLGLVTVLDFGRQRFRQTGVVSPRNAGFDSSKLRRQDVVK